MGFANCARSATAAPFATLHLLALHPSARTLLLLRSACAVLCRSRGQRQYACADWLVPRDLSRVSTIERHHRVRDHLERPRRKRGERRSELRAPTGRGIGMPTPLASEHHGDDHLEPHQASCQGGLRSTPTIGTARGAGPTASSGCNHDDHGVRRGRSTNEHIPTQDIPVRCRCGRGGTSPDADVAAVSPVLVPISHG
jgi:hypothetical protein